MGRLSAWEGGRERKYEGEGGGEAVEAEGERVVYAGPMAVADGVYAGPVEVADGVDAGPVAVADGVDAGPGATRNFLSSIKT